MTLRAILSKTADSLDISAFRKALYDPNIDVNACDKEDNLHPLQQLMYRCAGKANASNDIYAIVNFYEMIKCPRTDMSILSQNMSVEEYCHKHGDTVMYNLIVNRNRLDMETPATISYSSVLLYCCLRQRKAEKTLQPASLFQYLEDALETLDIYRFRAALDDAHVDVNATNRQGESIVQYLCDAVFNSIERKPYINRDVIYCFIEDQARHKRWLELEERAAVRPASDNPQADRIHLLCLHLLLQSPRVNVNHLTPPVGSCPAKPLAHHVLDIGDNYESTPLTHRTIGVLVSMFVEHVGCDINVVNADNQTLLIRELVRHSMYHVIANAPLLEKLVDFPGSDRSITPTNYFHQFMPLTNAMSLPNEKCVRVMLGDGLEQLVVADQQGASDIIPAANHIIDRLSDRYRHYAICYPPFDRMSAEEIAQRKAKRTRIMQMVVGCERLPLATGAMHTMGTREDEEELVKELMKQRRVDMHHFMFQPCVTTVV